VDHSKASYEGRIFLNNPQAGIDTPKSPEAGYAGSFYIFGHGGCAGDAGHCDVPSGPARPFDLRPEHQLAPVTQRVIVTDAVRRATKQSPTITISVVPIVKAEDLADLPDALVADLLHFERANIIAYQ
jgi:tyrosinase